MYDDFFYVRVYCWVDGGTWGRLELDRGREGIGRDS